MSIVFRPAEASDIPAVADLWHEGWMSGHAEVVPAELTRLRTLESFTERLQKHLPHTRVAILNNALIGFAILRGNEVYQFYLGADARGSGAASNLMEDALAHIRRSGAKRAWLDCSVGNNRAARFYEKSGWERTGVETVMLETSGAPFPLEVWRYEITL